MAKTKTTVKKTETKKEIKLQEAKPILDFHDEAIKWAFANGIIKANKDGSLGMQMHITKSELVDALFSFYQLIKKD